MAKKKAARRRPAAGKARKAAPRRAARKRTSRPARRSAPRKPRRRAAARTPAKKTAKKSAIRASTKLVQRKAAKKVQVVAKKPSASVKKVATREAAPVGLPQPKAELPRPAAKPAARHVRRRPPALDRERRVVDPDVFPTPPSSLDLDRSASAARTGRAEFNQKLHEHTSTGPALTGGDMDADWETADSVGDEAPGGDNPTPDQDVVDEIGRALGVEYDDDEELRGGDEIVERDRKRWELDPASSDDFDER